MPVPTGVTKVERRSLSDIATETIRAAILDGTLRPGERLNDKELEDWLGCSRTPIREALNELARVGLVQTAAQRYTRVSDPTQLDGAEISEALTVLIGGLARVALPTLNVADWKTLASALRDGSWAGVRQLVDTLCAAVPNERLRGTRDQATALIHIYTTGAGPEAADLSQLQAAVSSGDVAETRAALDELFAMSKGGA